jgi:hypothetical protein
MRVIEEKSVDYDPDRKVNPFLFLCRILSSDICPQLSLILEYVAGRVTDTLDRLIALYRPDSVVVGTRGQKSWQGMIGIKMGSVSKYVAFLPLDTQQNLT